MRKTEKKIRALNDMELRTPYEVHFLSKNEVKKIRFKNIQSFQALLELGSIVEVAPDEEENKPIPVVYPEIEEDKQKVAFKGIELPYQETLDGPVSEESKGEILVDQDRKLVNLSKQNIESVE